MTLEEFFAQQTKVAIAFSGGVDSAYLLYKASECNAEVKAYYVKSAFQPQFELDDALMLINQLGVDFTVIDVDVLSDKTITDNPSNRCYYCKKRIFSAIISQAEKDGFNVILDGTNASDDAGDRPGMKALGELKVLSPLRECGLTKQQIRSLSKEAGLFTWDKPAYACLATRIAANETITAGKLERTEKSENYMFSLGFSDFRIRSNNGAAKIQLVSSQFEKFEKSRDEIVTELKKYYKSVVLDSEARDG